MGQFIIDLPENKKGDVRWGTMSKIQFSFFHKNKSESKKAYIVHVSDSLGKMEYRLFKSKKGEWSSDPEGENELNDHLLILIKNAIIKREKEIIAS
jgi:hypothetical protein